MKPHVINSTDSFIRGWYIDTSVCDSLLELYLRPTTFKNPGLSHCPDNPVPDSKDSIDAEIPPHIPVIQPYLKQLKNCMDEYNIELPFSMGKGYSIKESMNIQHYPIGGGFKVWHYERASWAGAEDRLKDRHLVFMTYLNNVDDGGTEFFHQKLTIKAEKGLTLIWPADWTHTHKGQISYTKEKTIITGWLSYN